MTNSDSGSDPSPSTVRCDPSQLFRIRNRGYWHVRAHAEYGVIFTLCGMRVLEKETQPAPQPVTRAEVCGNCVRHL
ncbi:MAG: hypothetical protein HY900_15140 [Deltaproteobacteria bacterium]|nr:hypothetical protein [Deltaproteobacteria bacterium]